MVIFLITLRKAVYCEEKWDRTAQTDKERVVKKDGLELERRGKRFDRIEEKIMLKLQHNQGLSTSATAFLYMLLFGK